MHKIIEKCKSYFEDNFEAFTEDLNSIFRKYKNSKDYGKGHKAQMVIDKINETTGKYFGYCYEYIYSATNDETIRFITFSEILQFQMEYSNFRKLLIKKINLSIIDK